jgi:plasmid stabilization system protein ParE
MANLRIADEAEDEIEHARNYLSERSASAPATFLAEVRHVLGLIADAPEQWPEYDERYRFFALHKHSYVIYYEILDTETVRVVAVAHSSQQPDYWKGR